MNQHLSGVPLVGTLKRTSIGALAALFAMVSLAQLLAVQQVNSAPLTARKATLSTSVAGSTGVQVTFDYNTPTAGTKQGIIYEFCTTPLGACVLPTGMVVQSATHVSQSGWTGATAFAPHAVSDEGDCNMAAASTKICFERTDAGSTSGAVQHVIGAVTAPSSQQSVYIRISLYSDNAFVSGNKVDDGTVAVSFNDQLTVTGRVQERLQFCVAAVPDGGAGDTALPANVAACSALTDTTVDIGVIDNSSISMAPVDNNPPTSLGDDDIGVAMVNTNASNGTSVTFFAEPASSVSGGDTDQLRSFRVLPTDCNAVASTLTDQCFQSAAAGGTTIGGVGQEWFGIYVPCVDTSQAGGAAPTPMTVPAAYSGVDGVTTSAADCENTDKANNGGLPKIAWNDTSTAATLASAGSVLDNPIIKLSFVGSAAGTTPTGTYTVVTTYIATPTF